MLYAETDPVSSFSQALFNRKQKRQENITSIKNVEDSKHSDK